MVIALAQLAIPFFILALGLSNIAAETIGCPNPAAQDNGKSCTSIKTWQDFKKVISSSASGETVYFCPFSIPKFSNDQLVLEKAITLVCRNDVQDCVINAKGSKQGTIVKIKGGDAEVTMSGFVFQNSGSSSAAVRVSSKAGRGVKKQTICSCSFIG